MLICLWLRGGQALERPPSDPKVHPRAGTADACRELPEERLGRAGRWLGRGTSAFLSCKWSIGRSNKAGGSSARPCRSSVKELTLRSVASPVFRQKLLRHPLLLSPPYRLLEHPAREPRSSEVARPICRFSPEVWTELSSRLASQQRTTTRKKTKRRKGGGRVRQV